MVRLFIIFLIGTSSSLGMNPFYGLQLESKRKIRENDPPSTRSSREENDLSWFSPRNNFDLVFCEEIFSCEGTPSDRIMNFSASSKPVTPLITLEQCQEAIEKYPEAANLIIQKETSESPSSVAPPTFYDHFISFFPPGLMGREKTPNEVLSEKSCQMTREVFGLLQREYGEKIAAFSFASAPHRIAIAHPLSTKDLHEILRTAKTLKEQESDFSLMENDDQVQTLTFEVKNAEDKLHLVARAIQKQNALLDKKVMTAQQQTAIHKTHLGSSAFRVASLENAEHLAHQEIITIKDRLAIARRNALHENTDSDDSLKETDSEGTPLLSRREMSNQYGSTN